MEEKEIWAKAKEELKDVTVKNRKWLHFFINKWIDAEIEISKQKATMRSDWVFIKEIKTKNSKYGVEIETKVMPFRAKFWDKQKKTKKEMEHQREKYLRMFSSRE